ncbi:MAG: DNA-binding protein [Deltaproteobacteria bacterium]|nr:DNA-binding protein [Deltaproteobacteria bacterium]
MARITVEIEDSKAALLTEKAKKFGLLPDQFVTASIEDLIAQPESDFEEAMSRVLSKNKELYDFMKR